MHSKKFQILVFLQVILIALNALLISWSLLHKSLPMSTFYFSVVFVLQVALLYHHTARQNRSVFRFLESLKHRDDLTRLTAPETHPDLRQLMNEIAESYSRVKTEKESEQFYFLNTIRHVDVGLISFDETGRIELMNDAAKSLLNITDARHISIADALFKGTGTSLSGLEPGKSRLVKLHRDGELMQLSLKATVFYIKDRQVKLISIQDIRHEIQQEEIATWQKLIRVLTHEIMNSAGPITSLSATLADTFREDIHPHKIGEKTYDRIIIGLEAIQKRSRGLAKFVETYRSLTRLPEPVFTTVLLKDLLKQVHLLMEQELNEEGIVCFIEVEPENLTATIDEKLFAQVVINLIKNAVEGLKGAMEKTIHILAKKTRSGQVRITLEDNGAGIPEELIERVFVPFFTTSQHGSGIGLSLSRQIMILHNGTINIRSKEGIGTRVELNL